MARGSAPGERRGGRKKGAPNRKTAALQEAAAAAGIMPLDVMLNTMRWHYDAKRYDEAHAAARDAAPYLHPKLAAIEHSGKDGGPLVVEIVRFGSGEAS